MSFIEFLVMILVSSITAQPTTQKKISDFPIVTGFYIVYRNHTQPGIFPEPDKFVLRTSGPEIIHLLLTFWIIGMFVKNEHYSSVFSCLYIEQSYVFVSDVTMFPTP